MKTIQMLIALYVGLYLVACTTSTKAPHPANLSINTIKKNPIDIALYTGKKKPQKPYIILGQQKISKYNVGGIKRQEASIHDIMRHVAATAGGDAVINISNDVKTVSGTIIAFKKQGKDVAEKA